MPDFLLTSRLSEVTPGYSRLFLVNLEYLQRWIFHSLSEQLSPVLYHPYLVELFLISTLNFPWCNLGSLPFTYHCVPLRNVSLHLQDKILLAEDILCFLFTLNKLRSLCLSMYIMCLSLMTTLVALCWIPSSLSVSLLY